MSMFQTMKITPCFCLPLRGGTIFIAVIACIWAFAMWFATCISLIYSHVEELPFYSYRNDYYIDMVKPLFDRLARRDYQSWQFIRIVIFIFSLFAFIFSICLLHGVVKGKPTNMVPWLCIQFGGLFLFSGCNLAWLLTGRNFVNRFEAMIGLIFGLLMLIMYIYIFMVLLNYYKLLNKSQVKKTKNSGRVYEASFVPNAPFESV